MAASGENDPESISRPSHKGKRKLKSKKGELGTQRGNPSDGTDLLNMEGHSARLEGGD